MAKPSQVILRRLWYFATIEAYRLKNNSDRSLLKKEEFNDVGFYDRIRGIESPYPSVNMMNKKLYEKCAVAYLKTDKPVLQTDLKDLKIVSDKRDHKNKIFTPLEWFIGTGIGKEQLIKILKQN